MGCAASTPRAPSGGDTGKALPGGEARGEAQAVSPGPAPIAVLPRNLAKVAPGAP
jgi:hypothetical protein